MPDFNFLLLYVDDPAPSAAFYADLLAAPIVEQSPTFAMLPLRDGGRLGLWSRHSVEPKGIAAPGASEVAFAVGDAAEVEAMHADWKRRGLTIADLKQFPIHVGLQTETGYPHEGHLDYIAPTLNSSTGTLSVRGIVPNDKRVLLPGYFARVRVPFGEATDALLVPDTALGSDQSGRYLLVANKDNVVEQRKVQIGPADTHVTKQSNSFPVPNLFPDPTGPTGIGAFRNDFPGESGSRNSLRGPGYAGLDAALSKSWKLPFGESQLVKFRWEVFNVLNHPNFANPASFVSSPSTFGRISAMSVNPRVMQYGLKLEF